MDEKHNSYNHHPDPVVPEHLCRKTIKTMPTEVPYYLDPDKEMYFFYKGNGQFWVNSVGRLCTTSNIELENSERELSYKSEVAGRTGLMKVEILDSTAYIPEGYVVDLRMVAPETINYDDSDKEVPSDPEEAIDWHEEQRLTIMIDAFIYTDKDGVEQRCGDERFLWAVDQLAAWADALLEEPKPKARPTRTQFNGATKTKKIVDKKSQSSS